MKRNHSAVAVAVLALCVTAAHGSDLADVKARGKLILLTFPLVDDSFAAVDVEALRTSGAPLKNLHDPGGFHGIDIDLMKGFAQSLGVALEIQPELSGYAGLIPALDRHEGDVAANGFAITRARQKAADFSNPYFFSWDVAAVRPDSRYKSIRDLQGKRVAVVKGSSLAEHLKTLNAAPEVRFARFELEAYNAVIEKDADFTLLGTRAAVGQRLEAPFDGLKVGVRLSQGSCGIAVRKGSDLKAALDAYLEDLRKSGELERILTRYGQGGEAKP